mmetsp:Transcript_76496/g.203151  ORF Transcript_76496/g.203151 Transcript_76496/m.203151 type:complete len:275 (-) Transcript_76496:385-1209(-)
MRLCDDRLQGGLLTGVLLLALVRLEDRQCLLRCPQCQLNAVAAQVQERGHPQHGRLALPVAGLAHACASSLGRMHGPLLVRHLEVRAEEPLLAHGDLLPVAGLLGCSEVHLGLPEHGLRLAQLHVGGHGDVPRLDGPACLATLPEERPCLLRELQRLLRIALGEMELGETAHRGGLPRLVLNLFIDGHGLAQRLRHLIRLVALHLGHSQLVPRRCLALPVIAALGHSERLLGQLERHLLLASCQVCVDRRTHGLGEALGILHSISVEDLDCLRR